ncbi:hypothetical protein HBB16_17045 [Pseudonocardia sp. MCCB 268]|nr:hypothetical protein [Pseudonocardia cytotoxica]
MAALFVSDCRYVDPMADVTGHDGVDGFAVAYRRSCPASSSSGCSVTSTRTNDRARNSAGRRPGRRPGPRAASRR